MGALGEIITSFILNIASSFAYDMKKGKDEKKTIENIKFIISDFNRKFDGSVLDTFAFQEYISLQDVQDKIYKRIFESYMAESESINNFKIDIANDAIEKINKYYKEKGRSKVKDEDVFFRYFNDLIETLINIRNELLCIKASAQSSILVDKISESNQDIKEEIDKQFLDDKVNQVISRIKENVFVGEPPLLDLKYLRRTNLVKKVTDLALIAPVEIIGVSGSGKTSFAREVKEYVNSVYDDVPILYVGLKYRSNLRDMLLSIIISLTKLNSTKQSNIISQLDSYSVEFIKNATEKLNSNVKKIYILLDFIDGPCNNQFAKDLGEFLEAICFDKVKIIALGQESVFRKLSGLQREYLEISESIHMPGLNFKEFEKLVSFYHGDNYDVTFIWSIFEKLTAGRSYGLLARLARMLADSTLDKMKRLVDFPPDKIMEEADREKYNIIKEQFKTTAEKITCFLLPFSLDEANEIFQTDYISETVREMLRYGLLHHHDEEHLEMHETTRAGLEEMVPLANRKIIHEILANHYINKGDIITGILHLERAGKIDEANQLSREYFLRGEYWDSLYIHVFKHKLVDESEIIRFLEKEPLNNNSYLIPNFFEKIGNEETAQNLLGLIVKQSERFAKDFRWAWLITEVILVCNKNKIIELINYGIQKSIQNKAEVLEYIVFGARRSSITVDKELLEMFESQNNETKIKLMPFLLRDKRRKVLCKAMSFVDSYIITDFNKNTQVISTILSELKLNNKKEIIEFIASIPEIGKVADIIHSKSVLLSANLSSFIWENRGILLQVCKEVLNNKNEDNIVIENSLRIVAFLNDSDIIELAEKYIGKKGRLNSIAIFIITLFPNLINVDSYKRIILNVNLKHEERMSAFIILLSSNTDVDEWFKELCLIDNTNVTMWEYFLLINSSQRPCKLVIPILKKMIEKNNNEESNMLYIAAIMKISELQGEDIVDFLITLLTSPIAEIRKIASLCLRFKRSKRAIHSLIELCRGENDEEIIQSAVLAVLSSQPSDFYDMKDIWTRFPMTKIWRVTLAGRLRVTSEANYLISIASDSKESWQVRRSAIFAATQLKSKVTMKEISKNVFSEKISFVQDKNSSFLGHNILNILSLEFVNILKNHYRSEKNRTYELLAEVFDSMKSNAMFSDGTPSGEEASKWFLDKLVEYGWPEKISSIELVINKLNIPILYAAVLRGLRLCGCLEEIEKVIATADTEWLIMRATIELLKDRNVSTEKRQRIGKIIENSPFGSSVSIQNIIRNYNNNGSNFIQKKLNGSDLENNKYIKITYDYIKRALKEGNLQADITFIIVEIKKEEFIELVRELEPSDDYNNLIVPTEPKIKFIENGFSVNGTKYETIEKFNKIHATTLTAIRAALVAANRFKVPIPWHQSLLERNKYAQEEYVKNLLAALGAQKDSIRLYEELDSYGYIYIMYLSDYSKFKLVENLFDEKVIPFLNKWSSVESQKILETLCHIISCIHGSVIDNILATLFYRWCKLLEINYKNHSNNNIPLWRAFNYLKDNPRFIFIKDYDLRLSELLVLGIPWYNKNDIVEVLCKSPRMYSKIETLLINETPFEHHSRDKVDMLDEAAQKLFVQTD
ncbi:HEAT repeat domain-containing protein [Clostridium thailandense]|uniref:HEAT repeat domain-containing protein n=1 Tax=Clostridium thailandense TaxID=2794346 RepID=UPI00398A2B21